MWEGFAGYELAAAEEELGGREGEDAGGEGALLGDPAAEVDGGSGDGAGVVGEVAEDVVGGLRGFFWLVFESGRVILRLVVERGGGPRQEKVRGEVEEGVTGGEEAEGDLVGGVARRGDVEDGVFEDGSHLGGLRDPVGGGVLLDAERVDPGVGEAEGPSNENSLLEDGLELGDGYLLRQIGRVRLKETHRRDGAPSVA